MEYDVFPGARIYVTDLKDKEITLPEGIVLQLPTQTHTANVAVASASGMPYPDTDGLISLDPKIAVGVRTADCQPVLMYAQDIRAVAAVHAGWRGTRAHIAVNALRIMERRGASPENVKVFLGPSICEKCYEVSEELVEDFRAEGFSGITVARHLDLAALNAEDLVRNGILPNNIMTLGHCTRHTVLTESAESAASSSFRYPSWRRDPGTPLRLVSAIRLA